MLVPLEVGCVRRGSPRSRARGRELLYQYGVAWRSSLLSAPTAVPDSIRCVRSSPMATCSRSSCLRRSEPICIAIRDSRCTRSPPMRTRTRFSFAEWPSRSRTPPGLMADASVRGGASIRGATTRGSEMGALRVRYLGGAADTDHGHGDPAPRHQVWREPSPERQGCLNRYVASWTLNRCSTPSSSASIPACPPWASPPLHGVTVAGICWRV